MDLIDRQAAIEVIDAAFPVDPMKSEYTQGLACGVALAKTYIEQLPSAQPQRMRGRWIEIQAPDSDGNALYECSICHSGEVHVPIVEVPFCWHCGARMDGGEA